MRELTTHESEITDLFLELLDDKTVAGKDQAARFALSALPDRWLDTSFVHWLSEGTLTKIGRHILRVDLLDDTTHPLTREH
jgi:hypothetical protein